MPKSVFFRLPVVGKTRTILYVHTVQRNFFIRPQIGALWRKRRGGGKGSKKVSKTSFATFFYFADVTLDLPKLQYVAPKVQRQKKVMEMTPRRYFLPMISGVGTKSHHAFIGIRTRWCDIFNLPNMSWGQITPNRSRHKN